VTVRPLKPSDIAILKRIHEQSGFEYKLELDGPAIEAILVVADDHDRPVAAAIAERLIQVGLLVDSISPQAKMKAIRLLDHHLANVLRAKRYNEVNCFIPPKIAKKFGRRLEKSFQWVKNWPSWAKRF
jgi:hypothetical protein